MQNTLSVEGISCNYCVQAVTSGLNPLTVVCNASVNLDKKLATAEVSGAVTDSALQSALEEISYTARYFNYTNKGRQK